MTLSKWIVQTGPKKVAQIMQVDPATVSVWKIGKSLPRPYQMVKINKLTKGEVTYQSMIESFVKKNK